MSLRMLPTVYFQSGNAADVAKRLEIMVLDAIEEHQNKNSNDPFFINQGSMILLNRDIDHTCVLLHDWHYGAMVDDSLKIKNNKVKLVVNKKCKYDFLKII